MGKTNPGSTVATVVRKEYITPHFIRVYLTAEDLAQFKNTTIGDNNKLAIAPDGVDEVYLPSFDEERRQWIYPPKEVAPFIRTYTHRGIDLEKKELIIDFVHHGENGPASKWAINAKEGSRLGVMMRTEPKELYPQVDWYLLAGDATAIPVISAILETLPETAKGICILEVYGEEDEQQLWTGASIEFIWLHNPTPEKGSKMASVVRNLHIPDGSKFGYIATEFSSVKEIRTHLRKEKNWQQPELYAYSYWKAGIAEDKSQADRRKEQESV